jgi:hypothetical protein
MARVRFVDDVDFIKERSCIQDPYASPSRSMIDGSELDLLQELQQSVMSVGRPQHRNQFVGNTPHNKVIEASKNVEILNKLLINDFQPYVNQSTFQAEASIMQVPSTPYTFMIADTTAENQSPDDVTAVFGEDSPNTPAAKPSTPYVRAKPDNSLSLSHQSSSSLMVSISKPSVSGASAKSISSDQQASPENYLSPNSRLSIPQDHASPTIEDIVVSPQTIVSMNRSMTPQVAKNTTPYAVKKIVQQTPIVVAAPTVTVPTTTVAPVQVQEPLTPKTLAYQGGVSMGKGPTVASKYRPGIASHVPNHHAVTALPPHGAVAMYQSHESEHQTHQRRAAAEQHMMEQDQDIYEDTAATTVISQGIRPAMKWFSPRNTRKLPPAPIQSVKKLHVHYVHPPLHTTSIQVNQIHHQTQAGK